MGFSGIGRLCAAAAFATVVALAAPAAMADPTHTITVSGTGEVNAVPDQAQLSAGVTTVAATADAALADNARKMTTVFTALKKLGVPERSIQTSGFNVQPVYADDSGRGDRQPRITGYRVSNQVDVMLDDSRKLGAAIDALVGAGANQINSVSFAIKDNATLLTRAREAAIADARARAQTYAKAAGVMLGGVVSIDENGSNQNAFRDLQFRVAAAPATPTAAGELGVSVNVTVVFEIH